MASLFLISPTGKYTPTRIRGHGLPDTPGGCCRQGHRRLPGTDAPHALPEGALRGGAGRARLHRPVLPHRGGPHPPHRHREGHRGAGDPLRRELPPGRGRVPRVRGRAARGSQPHPGRRRRRDEQGVQALRVQCPRQRDPPGPLRRHPQGEGRRGDPRRDAQGGPVPPSQGRGPHGRGAQDVRRGIPLRHRFKDHPEDRVRPILRGQPAQPGTGHREAREGPSVDPAADLPEERLRRLAPPTPGARFFYPPAQCGGR